MVHESTMICVDNSEFMRNGDFAPTRLQCEQDAANLVIQCKLRGNPENAVGVLAMAGEVTVVSTMTQDHSRLFMKLHQLETRGECKFLPSIKVAHLALKHRQNRNHKMRIVLFCGSPVDSIDAAELLKIAKKMKKEKVQADVVCFGEVDSDSASVFDTFVNTLNGKDGTGSHLVIVPPGSTLTEALANSAVCRGEDGTAPINVGAGGFDFGEEEDPDLALALRVSLEEQRARQAAEAAAAADNAFDGAAAQELETIDIPMEPAHQAPGDQEVDLAAMTEEQQIEWALRMSMQDSQQDAQPAAGSSNAESMDTTNPNNPDDLLNNPELLQQMVDDLPNDGAKDDSKSKKSEEPPK